MNIPYYEMQRKNVHMIDTNSDVKDSDLINLLIEKKLIQYSPIRGKYNVYWVRCMRNDSPAYASKDIQLEVTGNKIFIGANGDLSVWSLSRELMSIFYKEFPFSNCREVRNYICGDIDWDNEFTRQRERVVYANDLRKKAIQKGARS